MHRCGVAMNKTGLVQAISERTGFTLKDTGTILGAFADVIAEAIKEGQEVSWVGFGTFSVIKRPARSARNFRTGENMSIAASRAVKFKAGKMLKSVVK